jgi:hypothetical protein
MKEERDNTSRVGAPPTSTSVHFSLRNEGSSDYIRLCEGLESLSPNFITFEPRHQFRYFFSKKIITLKIILLFHLFNAHHCRFHTWYLLNSRNRFPLYTPTKFCLWRTSSAIPYVSGMSHFHRLLGV